MQWDGFMEWNGMDYAIMEWDGMGRDGMEWNGMAWTHGMDQCNAMRCDGKARTNGTD